MKRFVVALGITILTSLYFFPFNTVLLPAVNTKMALAAIAIPLYVFTGAKLRNSDLNPGVVALAVCGFLVSLCGVVSVVVNNTGDYTYASYFVSMWVWVGGAYVVVKAMEAAYGKVTINMVGNFLIVVCVTQCFLAQIINSNAAVANWVDSFMVSTGFMGKHESRLYGIGCALDVAGLRFCTVLLMTTFFCLNPSSKQNQKLEQYLYILAFLIIAVLGCMIARTTTIGIVLSIILGVYLWMTKKDSDLRNNMRRAGRIFIMILMVLLPIIITLYNLDTVFRENLRFGFEGFFSLAESGEWNVRSNRQLMSMVMWPDNLKTWLIGDGYFENPQNDYYYVGPAYAYYMGTDVGYSRFVFYFGITGLIMFSILFVVSAIVCSKRNPKYTSLFFMIMLVNFIGWIKVSSDIFLVFAIFLCVIYNEPEENSISDPLNI